MFEDLSKPRAVSSGQAQSQAGMGLQGNQEDQHPRRVQGSLYPKSSSPGLGNIQSSTPVRNTFPAHPCWPWAGTRNPANSFSLGTQRRQPQKGAEVELRPFTFPKGSLSLWIEPFDYEQCAGYGLGRENRGRRSLWQPPMGNEYAQKY